MGSFTESGKRPATRTLAEFFARRLEKRGTRETPEVRNKRRQHLRSHKIHCYETRRGYGGLAFKQLSRDNCEPADHEQNEQHPGVKQRKADIQSSAVRMRFNVASAGILRRVTLGQTATAKNFQLTKDLITKYVVAVTLKDTSTLTIAEGSLEHRFILKFGVPDRLHSDDGEFFNSFMRTDLFRPLRNEKKPDNLIKRSREIQLVVS